MASPTRSRARAILVISFGLSASAVCPSTCGHAQEGQQGGPSLVIKDDVGRDVALHLPIRRSIVFNGATLELIRTIAGLGTVVGVDAGAVKERSYWPGVTDAMIVGQGQTTPNYEAIIALRPDIVFFPRNGDWRRAATTLQPFGIPVVVLTAWDPVRNDFNTDLIGRIYQQQTRAAELTAYCRAYGAMLNKRLAGVQAKSVYLEQEPPYTTVLKGSGWNDMILDAGAKNIFDDISIGDSKTARGNNQVFEVDPEEILSRKPAIIVKLEPDSYQPPSDAVAQAVLGRIADRPGFGKLDAVRAHKVYYLSRLLTHACSKVLGSLQLAKWLYPDRFADVDPTKDANNWLQRQGLHPVTPLWAQLSDP